MKHKRCTKCKERKLAIIKNFRKRKGTKEGLRADCRNCQNKCIAKYRNDISNGYKAGRKIYNKNRNDGIKLLVINHYGGKCACNGCRETTLEFLTIDHIKGGGTKHRKQIKNKGGNVFYTWLIKHKFPKGYQVLCFNCNFGKWANGGVCPHNKRRK